MAYKFQLGAARLSGSIQADDGLVSTDVDDATAANIVAQIDNGEIPIAKLSATTISGISLGSNLNSLSKATNGGVNFSSYNGSAAVSNLALDINDLAAAGVNVGADSIAIYDADADVTGKETISDLMGAVAGNGIAASSGVLSADLNGSSLQLSSDGLSVNVVALAGDGLVENSGVFDLDINDLGQSLTGDLQDTDLLAVDDVSGGGTKKAAFSTVRDAVFNDVSGDATIAAGGALTIAAGAVENSMLDNSDVTIGSTAIALGGTQTSIAGLTGLDFTAASAAIASSIGANNLTLGGSTSTVIIAGDLTVQGTTTTVDSTTINVSSSFTFEGVADDFETTLGIVDPAADRTVLLPNNSGVLAIFDPSASDSELATALTVVPSELNLLDGGTARGTTAFADGDGIIHNDNGTMRMTNVTKIAEYVLPKIVGGDVEVDSAGAAVIQANAVEGSMLNDNVISGQTELASGLASTDELLVSDAGTLKRMDASVLKTFIGSGTAAVNAIGDANATLAVGINAPSAASSASRTWTLPASAGLNPGESIVIKAYGNSGTNPLTIALVGSQEVDGSTENLVLESDNAAITLYYVAADTFIIV